MGFSCLDYKSNNVRGFKSGNKAKKQRKECEEIKSHASSLLQDDVDDDGLAESIWN